MKTVLVFYFTRFSCCQAGSSEPHFAAIFGFAFAGDSNTAGAFAAALPIPAEAYYWAAVENPVDLAAADHSSDMAAAAFRDLQDSSDFPGQGHSAVHMTAAAASIAHSFDREAAFAVLLVAAYSLAANSADMDDSFVPAAVAAPASEAFAA